MSQYFSKSQAINAANQVQEQQRHAAAQALQRQQEAARQHQSREMLRRQISNLGKR